MPKGTRASHELKSETSSASSSSCGSSRPKAAGCLLVIASLYVLAGLEYLPTFEYSENGVSRIGNNSTNAIPFAKMDTLLVKLLVQTIPGLDSTEALLERKDHSLLEAMEAMLDRREFCLLWDDHALDSDVWWTHNPDWFVSQENDTHYCFAVLSDPERVDYMQRLYRNQFENECSDTNTLTRAMWSSGWGADFRNVIGSLDYALEVGRPLQMWYPTGWNYAATKQGDRPVCPSADMYCFFLNLTNCPHTNITQEGGRLPPFVDRIPTWNYAHATRQQKWLRKRVYETVKTAVPGLADIHHSPDKECATIHVRRGDAAMDKGTNRHFYTFEEYFNGSKTLGHELPKNIFLLTDDQNAIEEAQRDYPDYNWMFFNRTRNRGDSGGWESHTPSGDPATEVVILLATFQLIQYCPTFVHGQSSFSELMWSIMADSLGENFIHVDLRKWLIDNHKEPAEPTI